MMSLKRKKKINPLPVQKKHKKKVIVIKSKEYKIWQPKKKKRCHQEMFLMFSSQ